MLELVEQAGLENRCTLTGTVGSNPTLSARNLTQSFELFRLNRVQVAVDEGIFGTDDKEAKRRYVFL